MHVTCCLALSQLSSVTTFGPVARMHRETFLVQLSVIAPQGYIKMISPVDREESGFSFPGEQSRGTRAERKGYSGSQTPFFCN